MNLFIILLIFAINENSTLGAKILGVFMTPSYSHQIVYQPIWRELSLRGHQVTVITPNPLHDARLINLTEIDVSSSYEIFRRENEKDILSERSRVGEIRRFSKIFYSLSQHQLGNSEVQYLINNKNQTFDLLLVEYLYPAMYALKDVFDCPMIGITSLGQTPFGDELIGNPRNPALEPDFTLPFSVSQSFEHRIYSALVDSFGRFLPRLSLMKRLDQMLPSYIENEIRPMSEICKDFSLVIVNSNLAIRNSKPLVPNLIEISGIHIKEPKKLPEKLKQFLDSSVEGAIYFSLGSNMKSTLIPQKTLDMMMEVFAELPYKVLWKFENENYRSKSRNILMQKWMPQQDILAHPNVKIFISQAGIQSVDEAIFRKVPLLMFPIFGDQEFNAHNIVEKGAGISLSIRNITKDHFRSSIQELMKNPKYQNNINKLESIASDQIVTALDKAIWWIEYVLRHDGAEHLRYAGRDVPFYQYYMLDLLAAFAASMFMVLYIVYFILRLIIVLFRNPKYFSGNIVKSNAL